MPTIDKTQDRQVETGVRSISPSTLYAQPWWRGSGNDNLPSGENTRDPITHETIQSQDSGGGVTKETGTDVAPQSGLNGSNNQEQQHLKHVASSTPPVIREHMEANSQMELVGHSIMLTQSYPYLDPQYAGMMTYGAPVPPHFYGIPQNRMLLPLQTEEEPVYVNAKQYNQILRRRERRAKAEAEKKVIQSRKPYLHESRHQHAMRRARGSGGRFLNTKKLQGNGTNSSEGKAKSGRAASTQSGNSSGSEHLSTSCDGNSDHQVDRSSVVQDLHEVQAFSNGHGLSSSYYAHSTGTEQGRVHINQKNWSLLREQVPDRSPRGAVPPK